MKKLLLLLAFFLSAFFTNAQAIQDWTSGLPSIAYYNNHTIATDSQGNVYSVGTYDGVSRDFDSGAGVFTMSSFSSNMYIVKVNATGNFVWAKQIGGATTYAITSATAITIDASDNIYIAGSTNKIVGIGSLDFDPGAGLVDVVNPTGHYVMYILKLDSNGNYLWNRQFNNPANTQYDQDKMYAIKVDASGNIYATGGFNGTVDFDPSVSGVNNITSVATNLSTDIFILKLSNQGNFLWAKALFDNATATDTKSNNGYAIDVDSSGNVYTTGYYWFGIDADPGISIHSLVSYTSNNPIITGGNTQYISKLDANGNYVWAYDLKGDHSLNVLPSLVVDNSNNVIISGYNNQSSIPDFDFSTGIFTLPIDTSSFIFKINANAGLIWAKSAARETIVNASHGCFSPGLALDLAGNIYSSGSFGVYGPVDFDPSAANYILTSAGANDGYISKLDTNGNFVWANKIGGTGNDYCFSIAVSPLGKVTVSGKTDTGFSRSIAAVSTGGFLASFSQPALATSQFDLDKNISVYPNPTTSEFNIKISENLMGAKATIYNILGQKIKDFTLNSLTTNQNLDKGMYLIAIEKDGNTITKKEVVN